MDPTGAGKTTIVNLLSRFYNIEEGQVCIDGQDIMKVSLRSLRSQMGILILDEATSSIDTGTEQLVQQGIHILMKGALWNVAVTMS